jgi:hypothetical protein
MYVQVDCSAHRAGLDIDRLVRARQDLVKVHFDEVNPAGIRKMVKKGSSFDSQ